MHQALQVGTQPWGQPATHTHFPGFAPLKWLNLAESFTLQARAGDTAPASMGHSQPGATPADPELQAPLLGSYNAVELQEDDSRPNFWPCSTNLTKVILGAGIMAIPHAVALLGVVWGVAALVAVGLVTWWTLHGAPRMRIWPRACVCGVCVQRERC